MFACTPQKIQYYRDVHFFLGFYIVVRAWLKIENV